MRCCPRVVPVLPPTGATTVASLNPTLGGSAFTMVIVAAPLSARGVTARKAANKTAARFLLVIYNLLVFLRRVFGRDPLGNQACRRFVAGYASLGKLAVGRFGDHHVAE